MRMRSSSRSSWGSTQTGQYGAAYRLFVVLQFLPAIYFDSVLRTMSHLATQSGYRVS